MKHLWFSLVVIVLLDGCSALPHAVFRHGAADEATSVADIEAVAIPGVATTAAEHRALARAYEEKAASYRAEKATCRRNAYTEEQRVPVIPKTANENPRIKKIRQNRDEMIDRAERLARAAERLALFHAMRATEVASQ